MTGMAFIAFILFILGISLIAIGVIGVYRNRGTKSLENNKHATPPNQPKGPLHEKNVLQRMQQDKELRKKILEEIEKKSR